MRSSPYPADISRRATGRFRPLTDKTRMTKRSVSLEHACSVGAILTCAVLGLLLSDGVVICLLTSLTLLLTDGTTKGFLFILSEIVFAYFSFYICPNVVNSRRSLRLYVQF